MEKPIVLKQRLRFRWFWAALFALQIMFLLWGFWRDSTGVWFWLPFIFLMNASVFFARVTLEVNQIVVRRSLTDVCRHRFLRILRYLVKPYGNRLDVELTIEQILPQNSELFGIEFPIGKRKPPSIQEVAVSFSVELEQSEILMDYLHAQGAVGDVFAETDWRKLQILLASGREIRRLKQEQGKLSGEQMQQVLKQTEAKLLKAEEEL